MTASERIRAARLQKDKHLVSALDQNPAETRGFTTDYVDPSGEWVTYATSRTWDGAHNARVELRAMLGESGRIRITGP